MRAVAVGASPQATLAQAGLAASQRDTLPHGSLRPRANANSQPRVLASLAVLQAMLKAKVAMAHGKHGLVSTKTSRSQGRDQPWSQGGDQPVSRLMPMAVPLHCNLTTPFSPDLVLSSSSLPTPRKKQ